MDALDLLYLKPLPSTRNGPLYNAFSYPTKISPEAIALFIATHTQPGATVLDTFAGSGTTGLATLLCDRPTAVMKQMASEAGLTPQWGPRQAVLYEIGTLGAFVSRTMCSAPDPHRFEEAARELLDRAEKVLQEVWSATGPQGESGRVRHIVWSDVLLCPHCQKETSYWNASVRRNPLCLVEEFDCSSCGKRVVVNEAERATEQVYDDVLNCSIVRKKRVPARVYGQSGTKKWQREPTTEDLEPIERARQMPLPACAPRMEIVWGDLHRAGYHKGISHLHHFYTRRNFLTLATLWQSIDAFEPEIQDALRLLVLSYNATHSTLMTRVVVKDGQSDLVLTGAQSGVLYVSGLPVEKNVLAGVRRKMGAIKQAFETVHGSRSRVEVVNASSTQVSLPDKSVDYVFTDPPFGDFIPYAELNQLNEAWLGQMTDRRQEAIVSVAQGKSVGDYGRMIGQVFCEISRVLKDDGQATVVFHSAKAAVWRALAEAYAQAGLRVRATSVLDKLQASFKQVVSTVSVKGDPLLLLEKSSIATRRSTLTSDDIFSETIARAARDGGAQERLPTRLYSRFVSRCLELGVAVPLSAGEFYLRAKQAEPFRAEPFDARAADVKASKDEELEQNEAGAVQRSLALEFVGVGETP